ncbi:MAG TPA: hypothetical protein VN858_05990 [Casimicrobiaceae bacterium]|nr:hypothetical protein [Casimicrobiaceae bacterium]
MKTGFASGSSVEAVVTLTAAAMMTFAWLAMADDSVATGTHPTPVAICVATPAPG